MASPVSCPSSAAVGRQQAAPIVFWERRKRENERGPLCFCRCLSLFCSLCSLFLSRSYCSLSLSLPPSPSLLIRSDVSLDITGTHWQRQRDREKKTRSLERAPPRESTKRESDDRSNGFSSFFLLLSLNFCSLLNNEPLQPSATTMLSISLTHPKNAATATSVLLPFDREQIAVSSGRRQRPSASTTET